MKTIYMGDDMYRQARRLKHQSHRMDRIYRAIGYAHEDHERRSRVLKIQNRIREDLGIILEVVA